MCFKLKLAEEVSRFIWPAIWKILFSNDVNKQKNNTTQHTISIITTKSTMLLVQSYVNWTPCYLFYRSLC